MRKRLLIGALATLALVLPASPAAADTWSGSCEFEGDGYFDPPYSYVPANRNYVAEATGTCDGMLNGARYAGPAHIRLDGRMNAPMSCGVGATPRISVPGTLTFDRDPQRVDAPRVGLLIGNVHTVFADHFVVLGAYTGEALGQWLFTIGFDTHEKCMQDGLSHLPFTMTIDTLRTLRG